MLFQLCFIVTALSQRPRIATLAAGTTPDFLMRGSPAALPNSLWQMIVGAWAGWPVSDSLSNLTFSNHWFVAHICDLLDTCVYVCIYIYILCHCSHFHSVGEQNHVISPRVSFLLLPTASLSISLMLLLSSFPLSTLYSWCGKKIRYAYIKGTWMDQLHFFFPPLNFSVLVWRIMGQK